MKVSKISPPFAPIQITLETSEEALLFQKLMNRSAYYWKNDSSEDDKSECEFLSTDLWELVSHYLVNNNEGLYE